MISALKNAAAEYPNKIAFRYLRDGDFDEEIVSFSALNYRVTALAAHLALITKHGDRALWLYPQGIDFRMLPTI